VLKIGLITTLDTNIGDDFIREGILVALREVFDGTPLEFVMINKHKPYSMYPSWHPIHWSRFAPKSKKHGAYRLAGRIFPGNGASKFEDCDAVIQCGAPVFWYDCSKAEWAEIIWNNAVRALHKKIPVLNLAAGSCYPWEKRPTAIDDPADRMYIEKITGYCRETTVRDRCSHEVLNSLNISAQLIPCSALLAAIPYQTIEASPEFIMINYMRGGGHYDFQQSVDCDRWESAMKEAIQRLRPHHRMAFLCHNQKEYDLAGELDPGLPRFFPRTVEEYFNVAALAKAGIFNRMHASVGLAGLGIPSVAVGTDTRMLMVDQIGLPVRYAKDADADYLVSQTEQLLERRDEEKERLLSLQKDTAERYHTVLEETLLGKG
jgi:hypothetical protein